MAVTDTLDDMYEASSSKEKVALAIYEAYTFYAALNTSVSATVANIQSLQANKYWVDVSQDVKDEIEAIRVVIASLPGLFADHLSTINYTEPQ